MRQLVAHRGNDDTLGLTIRCIVERRSDQWQAFSLEFGLAAQGDSMPDAKRRLDSMIRSYVHDALVGEDREHAHELLTRRATWPVIFRYYLCSVLCKSDGAKSDHGSVYRDPIPLEPKPILA